MNPFFQDDLTTIHCGDARDILPNLPRGLIVTDPPFNIGYTYDEHDDRMPIEEYQELLRLTCPPPCVVVHYPEQLCAVSWTLEEIPTRMVAWVYPSNMGRQWRGIAWFGITPDFKRGGQPYKNPTDKRVKKLIAAGKKCRLYDWWQINQVKNVSKEKTKHPCQMPVEVMRRILTITKCDLVIDPFMGSGTTLVAARQLGIRNIGIDLSKDYCAIARGRM